MNQSLFKAICLFSVFTWPNFASASESTPTMRNIFGAVLDLQPLAADVKALANPENRSKVEKTLATIEELRMLSERK